MKSFFRTLLAVIVANILIFGIVILAVAMKMKEGVDVKSGTVLIQDLDGPIAEYDPPSSGIPFSESQETLTSILENLEKASRDKRIEAVVLRLGSPEFGWASMGELRARIAQLRRAGKPVYGYTEALNNRNLYLGAACDSLFLLPGGYVSLHGFAAQVPRIKGTLEKLGIKDNVHKIEKYKSAAEIVQRKDLSPEARENIDWIIDEIYPDYIGTIESERGMAPGDLESKVFAAGALVPREALELGLVDRLAYFDQVEASLLAAEGIKPGKKSSSAAPERPRMISGAEYAKVSRKNAGIKGKKTIAVVHAQGMISGEKSGFSFPFGMTMGAGTMETALRSASENKKVAAIVLRVDSGGGESSTSWRISRAVKRAGREKPLVVSMSDVAASGAYMISYPCSTLVAEPLSIVGSIGSISGKFNMRGFYDKLGVTWDFVTRGPNALINSDYFDYTPEQYESFTSRHWMDYWEWVEDIARERNLTPAEVDSAGRGRVWTGRQALSRGLIDTLGGFDLAVQIAKAKAGIPEDDEVRFVHYPKKEGLLEALRSGGFAAFLFALTDQVTAPFRYKGTWAVEWRSYR